MIHKDTDLLTVVTEFAFTDTPVSGTAAKEWEAKYAYRPMVCTFYCKELAGFTTTGLSEYLTDAERACARTLGFDPEQFAPDKTAPDRTTLDRTWRDRFSDRLKSFITQSAQLILAVAHDMGNPLRMRALKPTDKIDCSNRTERRYVTEKAKDVTDALCQIVYPAIDLDRPVKGTQYGDTAFLDLQSYLGLTGTAANQGSQNARRWGIENSYKSIKDFLAWTTSRNTAVRVFYFGFAVILYDMWLVVDLLVQISLTVKQRLKPRVPARTFLNIVRKEIPVT